MSFMPSSSNKELSCVLFFAERKEETRLRHRVRQSPDVQIQWCVRLGQSQRHLAWHRRWESRLDLDLHVTNTSNYGCSEVRFRQYTEKREDFSPNLFQDEYSTEDCNLSVTCKRPEHTQWHGWVEECWYHNAQTRQVITIIASELTNIDYQIRPTNQPNFSSLRDRRSEDQDNPNF